MRKAFILSAALLAIWYNPCFAGCTLQEIRDLKAANFSIQDIDEICPKCSATEMITLAQQDKTKDEIIKLCRRATEPVKNHTMMPWYVLIFTKPITVGFEAYHTDKVLKNEEATGTLKKDKTGGDIFNLYAKYTLPISSLTYALDAERPEKPHPLLRALKLYVEGNYGNSINSTDGGSGLTVKTKKEAFYKAGIKFETDLETLLSRGRTYQYYNNY